MAATSSIACRFSISTISRRYFCLPSSRNHLLQTGLVPLPRWGFTFRLLESMLYTQTTVRLYSCLSSREASTFHCRRVGALRWRCFLLLYTSAENATPQPTTDCPLQLHHTPEPLVEEYSLASQVDQRDQRAEGAETRERSIPFVTQPCTNHGYYDHNSSTV